MSDAIRVPEKRSRGFLRDNSLTIALSAAVVVSLVLMLLAGWNAFNEERVQHGEPVIGLAAYARSGDFLSAVFENWESEFLQMAAYVCLTAMLFQRGSAESRDPDEKGAGPSPLVVKARTPVQRLGAWIYSYSLGITLALLFIGCFVAHLVESARKAGETALLHGMPPPSVAEHLGSATFWFESMQNWQSEFLSTAVLVVLSIWLRFHGSPESKPVDASDCSTGS